MKSTPKQEIKLFYCYSREDKPLRVELEKHLSWLKRRYQLENWYDREIAASENWEHTIDTHLYSANLILVLISPDFMASDYCYGKEMQYALEQHKAGRSHVVPILLRPAYWEDAPFSYLQHLPTNGRPITRWPDLDEAFQNVVTGINRFINELLISLRTKEDWFKEGSALKDLKRYDEALAAFEQAIILDPTDADAYFNKGSALFSLGRYDEALAAFEQAIILDPTDADAYLGKGIALSMLERYDETLAAYEQITTHDPKQTIAYLGKGNALSMLERYDEALAAYEQGIHLNPNDASAYLGKGNALSELKRYDEALAAFEQAITLDPTDADAYFNKGNALKDLKRYDEALAAFEQAITLDPNYADAYFNKGNALKDLKRYDEALAAFEQAITLDPTDASAYFNKGSALKDLKRYDEALAAFEQAITLDPTDASAYFNKGNALKDLKRYDEALAAFEQAITLDPTDASAYFNKGNALKDLKRYDEALAAFEQAITLDPTDASAYFNKGNALKDLKRYDEALAAFEQAITLDPTDASAYFNKGSALKDLKRYDEALAAFEQAITLDPTDADAYINKGIALKDLKRYDEALAAFEQAITLDPKQTIAYLGKGNALSELKRYDEALAAFEQAITLNPKQTFVYFNKGNALSELKRYDEALVAFEQAITLDPTDADAYINKGIALKDLKRYDEALAAFEQAITLDPNYAGAYINKGNVLSMFERYDEALAAFEQAIILDPTGAAAYLNKGNTFSRLERYDEALAAFEQAITPDPNNAVAYFNKGITLSMLERYDEALAAFEHAIILDPTDAAAYLNKGDTLKKLERFEEAVIAYEQAATLDPTDATAYALKGNVLSELNRYEEALAAFEQAATLDPTNTTYVNKGNALKELKVKGILPKKDDTRAFTDSFQPSIHYRLPSVFVQSGTPEVTFVARQDFRRLKLSLEQPGRGVVIEGPSGVGKTTSVEKAIEDLKKLYIPIQQTLSARNPEHRTAIQTLRKWHNGIVIIDDFHRLDQALRQEIVDYLKELADNSSRTKQLTIVGIPHTGQSLVDTSFDIATRLDIFSLGQVNDELILQMIEKGEDALNIRFDCKAEIVKVAHGSLNLAQFLCFSLCEMAGILETQSKTKVINCDIDSSIQHVMTYLARKFENSIRHFIALGGPKDRIARRLLEEIAFTDDGFLSLPWLKNSKPELAHGIQRFIDENWMEKFYEACPKGASHLFFDKIGYALVIDDPQLSFYLKNVNFSTLEKKAGKALTSGQPKVFISYSHKDSKWLNKLRIHLKPLEREGVIELWSDKKIEPGFQWRTAISNALETSSAAILLISANFLASDFIDEHELPALLEHAKADGTTIIPIILSPCIFTDTSLSSYQSINDPNEPLSTMSPSKQDQVLVELAHTIMKLFQGSLT